MTVALLTPLHDPRGALVAEVDRVRKDRRASAAWTALRATLADVVATASPEGSAATRDAFASLGFRIVARSEAGPGSFMWSLADLALALDADHYFVPDSDRLLHWLLAHADELAELPRRWGQQDVLNLARSPQAFASHPPMQTLTEGPAMALIAHVCGWPGADPFSGAYLLSRRALEAVVVSDAPRDETFYAEAFLAPARAGCSFDLWSVEGLEWETPDLHRAEIAARGHDAWLAGLQGSRQWEHRARMAALWIERVRVYLRAKDR